MKIEPDAIKGKIVINQDGKMIECNSYDNRNHVFYDFRNGKGKNNSLSVSIKEIEEGKAHIQMKLF